MSGPGEIVLNGKRPAAAVARANVYFTFADGRLSYDCIACNAQCCRGHGYAINAGRELDTHLALRPALRLFLTPTSGPSGAGRLVMRNFPPACGFLDGDGRCGVQLAHGYEAKPETCRLFPFNRFRRIGDYLVVSPHATLCPLEVAPAGTTSERSSHASLFEAMAQGGVSWDVLDAVADGETADSWITRERAILARSESHLDDESYVAFAAVQARLTTDSTGESTAPALEALRLQVEQLLGAASLPLTVDERRQVTRTLVACTAALRSQLLLATVENGRRAAAIDRYRVPHLLLSLGALAALARATGARVTHQTLFRFVDEYFPLLRVLADADRHVAWKPDAGIDLSLLGAPGEHQAYLRLAKALLPAAQRRHPRTLGSLLADTVQDDSIGHLGRLNTLAGRIAGRVAPIDQHEQAGRAGVRTAMRRLALRTLSQETLTRLAQRRSRLR